MPTREFIERVRPDGTRQRVDAATGEVVQSERPRYITRSRDDHTNVDIIEHPGGHIVRSNVSRDEAQRLIANQLRALRATGPARRRIVTNAANPRDLVGQQVSLRLPTGFNAPLNPPAPLAGWIATGRCACGLRVEYRHNRELGCFVLTHGHRGTVVTEGEIVAAIETAQRLRAEGSTPERDHAVGQNLVAAAATPTDPMPQVAHWMYLTILRWHAMLEQAWRGVYSTNDAAMQATLAEWRIEQADGTFSRAELEIAAQFYLRNMHAAMQRLWALWHIDGQRALRTHTPNPDAALEAEALQEDVWRWERQLDHTIARVATHFRDWSGLPAWRRDVRDAGSVIVDTGERATSYLNSVFHQPMFAGNLPGALRDWPTSPYNRDYGVATAPAAAPTSEADDEPAVAAAVA